MSAPAAIAPDRETTVAFAPDAQRQAREFVLRTPLVPVALAATAGVILERAANLPVERSMLGLDEGLVLSVALALMVGAGWLHAWRSGRLLRGLISLWIVCGLLGASWHRLWRMPAADDIGLQATIDGHLLRVRGTVLELEHTTPAPSPLRSRPDQPQSEMILRLSAALSAHDWQPASGRVKTWIASKASQIDVGDEVEVLGRLHKPAGPSNPGEADTTAYFRDQGVNAFLYVKTADAMQLLRKGRSASVTVPIARLRAWAAEQLRAGLPADEAGVAVALLLGEQSALDRREFETYQRTGVFHVLAISGQHVSVLCGALWLVFRVLHVPRRFQALAMMLLVIGYTLLTGAQPPMVRSATVVSAFCIGVLLRRKTQALNSLALAWLVTILLNPTDIFRTGCQISFLGVLMLFQVIMPWHRWATQEDALAKLVSSTRPLWERVLRQIGSWVGWTLLANLVLGLAFAPLLAARYHLVSPIAVPLGPIMVLLTSVALITGFLYLLVSPLGGWLPAVLAWIIEQSLSGCDVCVRSSEALPLSHWYTSGVPEWTLWAFYLPLLAVLLVPQLARYWRIGLFFAAGWLVLVLAVKLARPSEPGLRCTVLAVGHGSCVVLEAPDGRVLLYDAGSLAGPEVTARQIAPFLWHRGITRIDEVLISHADLDHFNGLPALLDRFRVGQISLTPSFSERQEPAVRVVLADIARRGVGLRVLARGQRLAAGDVEMQVLHPPTRGPEGKENARSLVLLVAHAGRTLLLTGDLEEPGLSEVKDMPRLPVDVLIAPHHGSRFSNTEAFADWARPGLVISSEGRPRGTRVDPYSPQGATVWRTWQDGAATIIMDGSGVHGATFRTKKQWAR